MKTFFSLIHIAPEAAPIFIVVLCIAVIAAFLWRKSLFITFIFIGSLLFFFRDPVREFSGDPTAILAPADGTVADIAEVTLPQYPGVSFVRIGIFLSLLNVHVQRVPCDGVVESIAHRKGSCLLAFSEEARKKNRAVLTLMKTEEGIVAVQQLTGLIARRIINNLSAGQTVHRGERLGIICFGSRVELYLPKGTPVSVAVGEAVRGGETIVAGWEK